MKNHQIKCEHCHSWVSAKYETCENCSKTLRAKEKSQALNSNKKRDSLKPDLIQIYEHDKPIVQVGKHIIRTGQIILYAIIGFLVWITTWAVG